MPSTDVPKIETQFNTLGTLTPPGLIGRIVRLLMGLLCVWPLIELWRHGENFLGDGLRDAADPYGQ